MVPALQRLNVLRGKKKRYAETEPGRNKGKHTVLQSQKKLNAQQHAVKDAWQGTTVFAE